jgi:hypothetical protein
VPFWKCPSCATWATPQRLLPQATSASTGPDDMSPFRDAAAPIVAVRQAPTQSDAQTGA